MLLTLTHVDTPPKDFYKAKISTFKSIGAEHPEVLAEWRAKRAATYVAKHADALAPPPHRDATGISFRPGGILPAKTVPFSFGKTEDTKAKSKKLQPLTSEPMDIKMLAAELARTEEMMARQHLKIKLNTKPPKRFEESKHERVSAHAKTRPKSLADSP